MLGGSDRKPMCTPVCRTRPERTELSVADVRVSVSLSLYC